MIYHCFQCGGRPNERTVNSQDELFYRSFAPVAIIGAHRLCDHRVFCNNGYCMEVYKYRRDHTNKQLKPCLPSAYDTDWKAERKLTRPPRAKNRHARL